MSNLCPGINKNVHNFWCVEIPQQQIGGFTSFKLILKLTSLAKWILCESAKKRSTSIHFCLRSVLPLKRLDEDAFVSFSFMFDFVLPFRRSIIKVSRKMIPSPNLVPPSKSTLSRPSMIFSGGPRVVFWKGVPLLFPFHSTASKTQNAWV